MSETPPPSEPDPTETSSSKPEVSFRAVQEQAITLIEAGVVPVFDRHPAWSQADEIQALAQKAERLESDADVSPPVITVESPVLAYIKRDEGGGKGGIFMARFRTGADGRTLMAPVKGDTIVVASYDPDGSVSWREHPLAREFAEYDKPIFTDEQQAVIIEVAEQLAENPDFNALVNPTDS